MTNDTLKKFYVKAGETFDDALLRACAAYSVGDPGLCARLYTYARNGWFMFSSPMLSNAPPEGQSWGKALPISCYGNFVKDTISSLCSHTTESRYMSVAGGGIGAYWGNVRAVDDKSPGAIPFLHTMDSDVLAYKQGKTRRAAYAAYLDVSHPDIEEFISMRLPTGGDINRKNLNLHHGVNITDQFLLAVNEDGPYDLVDPHTGRVTHTVRARQLWQKILETRYRTGEPYITYIDEANRCLPQSLKDLGMRIHASQLCNEIYLPSDEHNTFVCCLSSLNLEQWDAWRDTNIIGDMVLMLNNALDIFIQHAPKELHKAVMSAKNQRDIGLGMMGFHALLQKMNMPFESPGAVALGQQITHDIQSRAKRKSQILAIKFGPYPRGTKGDPYNAHLVAIAPNANSALLLNTSPGIEPWISNAYTQYTRAGAQVHRNKYLAQLLKDKGKDTAEVWESIALNKGSVRHLDFLSDYEKSVFATAFEIDQMYIIRHARARQRYICQGQSVNVFFPANASREYVNKVHLAAFDLNGEGSPLKGLYYLRTQSGVSTEYVSNKIACVGCD